MHEAPEWGEKHCLGGILKKKINPNTCFVKLTFHILSKNGQIVLIRAHIFRIKFVISTFPVMAATFIPINLTEPDYLTITQFERDFNLTQWRLYFGDGNWIASLYISAIYVVCVFGGEVVMKQKEAFKLNGLLTIWNVALAAMSVWAFLRCAPEFLHTLLGENGFHNSICEW